MKSTLLRLATALVLAVGLVTLAHGEQLHSSSRSSSKNLRGGIDDVAGEELPIMLMAEKKEESGPKMPIVLEETDDDVVLAANDLAEPPEKGQKMQASATTTSNFQSILQSPRHLSSSFQSEWRQLDPDERWFVLLGMAVAFLACWCFMTCLCNCLRACFFPGSRNRTEYRQIDSAGRTVVYRDSYYNTTGPNRPCMNLLWGTCCFECCCRDNQDVDCCKMCCPLLLVECCCPP